MVGLSFAQGAAGLDAQGQLEAFAVGLDGAVWVIWQNGSNNGWSGWQSLGTPPGMSISPGSARKPVVAANGQGPLTGPGRLELFLTGSDNALWDNSQRSPGVWSGWASLGGSIVGIPGAGKNADGRIEVFAKGTDSALWHVWQTGTGWSGFASLGGQVNEGAPVVGLNRGSGPLNNCLQVVVLANPDPFTSHYDYLVQNSPGGGWSGWTSFGGWQGDGSSLGQNQDGRLELFAIGQNALSGSNISHIWQNFFEAATNSWSGWGSFANPPGGIITPIAAQNADGRLEIFGVAPDGNIWHIWQVLPNGGWSDWDTLGAPDPGIGQYANCFVGNNADGRLEVFVVGQDNSLWHIWQTAPNNGWSGWGTLGAP